MHVYLASETVPSSINEPTEEIYVLERTTDRQKPALKANAQSYGPLRIDSDFNKISATISCKHAQGEIKELVNNIPIVEFVHPHPVVGG